MIQTIYQFTEDIHFFALGNTAILGIRKRAIL